jgi:hypothetical protein
MGYPILLFSRENRPLERLPILILISFIFIVNLMKQIIEWLNESLYIPPLSPACKMCAEGSKMVVLVTGLCSTECFYCPLSWEKSGKDKIYADEWELQDENDVEKLIEEAKLIDATGAGITGGDPLIVWERVKRYISLLKDTFGSGFHIHLYTSAFKNSDRIADLIAVGLDEVRFHPLPRYWRHMDKNPVKDSIKQTLDTSADVAIEIPLLPGMEEETLSLIKWADNYGIHWVNLNELEYSESNFESLNLRGYSVKDDVSAAVKGSHELGVSVLKTIMEIDLDIGVHYCSVSFKDGIQLRNRIKRRAYNVAKKYEVITEDGTLLKGIIPYESDTFLRKLVTILKEEYDVSEKFLFLDKEKNRVEIGLWILEEIAPGLKNKGYECFMVEEYPTADRLEVERTPLPIT